MSALRVVKADEGERGERSLQFLRAIWGEGPEDGLITLFSLPSAVAFQHPKVEDAAKHAISIDNAGGEVYINVASLGKVKKGRGKASDAKLLAALALDLDVAGAGRKKRCFPSVEEALRFSASLALAPSIVVLSGGGVHVWWLLKESETAATAGATWKGWLRYVQGEAAQFGVDVDPVADLARVLRLPGTTNRKYDKPIQVTIGAQSDFERRYTLTDFERYAPAETITKETLHAGKLSLSSTATPPLELFLQLMENDTKFKLSWEHKRKDLKDSSQSGYDMALANIAVRAGWTDQEVANLMINNRAKHGADLKLREGYYQGTIDNARRSMNREEVLGEIEASGSLDTSGEEGSSRVFDFFSAQTGATVTNVLRSVPTGDRFVFEFDDGNRSLHISLAELVEWRTFWRVLNAAGFQPHTERPKEKNWLALVNALSRVAEPMEVEISSDELMVVSLFERLVSASAIEPRDPQPSNKAARAEVIRSCRGAFFWDDKVWVRMSGLLDQAKLARVRDVDPAYMRAALRSLGAERRNINAGGRGGICYGLSLLQLRSGAGEEGESDANPDSASPS